MRWIAVSLVYLASAVILLINGEATLIAIAIAPVYVIVTRIWRPPSWRLERVLRAMRRDLLKRRPPIVQTRVMEWTRGAPTVYLVCAKQSDEVSLRAQESVLRELIVVAARGAGLDAVYLANLRLWLISRQNVEREGGWFGFDHNVPWPRFNSSSGKRS